MPNSKKWLIEAEHLCKKAKHTLSVVLAGEVKDDRLLNLEVIDVSASNDGQFLIVSIDVSHQELSIDENLILAKLKSVQGYLRSVIANSVKRKRVPALKFRLLETYKEDSDHAYSKDYH